MCSEIRRILDTYLLLDPVHEYYMSKSIENNKEREFLYDHSTDTSYALIAPNRVIGFDRTMKIYTEVSERMRLTHYIEGRVISCHGSLKQHIEILRAIDLYVETIKGNKVYWYDLLVRISDRTSFHYVGIDMDLVVGTLLELDHNQPGLSVKLHLVGVSLPDVFDCELKPISLMNMHYSFGLWTNVIPNIKKDVDPAFLEMVTYNYLYYKLAPFEFMHPKLSNSQVNDPLVWREFLE